jgi:hypothetical protein
MRIDRGQIIELAGDVLFRGLALDLLNSQQAWTTPSLAWLNRADDQEAFTEPVFLDDLGGDIGISWLR